MEIPSSLTKHICNSPSFWSFWAFWVSRGSFSEPLKLFWLVLDPHLLRILVTFPTDFFSKVLEPATFLPPTVFPLKIFSQNRPLLAGRTGSEGGVTFFWRYDFRFNIFKVVWEGGGCWGDFSGPSVQNYLKLYLKNTIKDSKGVPSPPKEFHNPKKFGKNLKDPVPGFLSQVNNNVSASQ